MERRHFWDEALDARGAFVRRALEDIRKKSDDPGAEVIGLINAFKVAPVYVWKDEIVNAVKIASRKLPTDTRFSTVMLPPWSSLDPGDRLEGSFKGWWWLGKDTNRLTLLHGDDTTDRSIVTGIAVSMTNWNDGYKSLMIEGMTHDSHGETTIAIFWGIGETIEDAVARNLRAFKRQSMGKINETMAILGWIRILQFVGAGLVWMQQKIVVPEQVIGSRAARRRAEAADYSTEVYDLDIPAPYVTVLRKAEHSHDGSPTGRKVGVRYYVDGFWRNQFYPSTGDHAPKFVVGHWRGEGPTKWPTEKIFKVSR